MERIYGHFGLWLKRWREERELTQDEVGELAGISKQYVSNIERNQASALSGSPTRPDIEVVDRLAKALNRPVWEARKEAGYGIDYPPNIQEAINLLLNADPSNRDEIIELIKFVAAQRKLTNVKDLPPDYDETKQLRDVGKKREG